MPSSSKVPDQSASPTDRLATCEEMTPTPPCSPGRECSENGDKGPSSADHNDGPRDRLSAVGVDQRQGSCRRVGVPVPGLRKPGPTRVDRISRRKPPQSRRVVPGMRGVGPVRCLAWAGPYRHDRLRPIRPGDQIVGMHQSNIEWNRLVRQKPERTAPART